LPGLERLIAISTQIFLSVLVWKAVRTKNFGWFALAFVYHMVIDGIGVFLSYTGWGAWGIEGILSIFMLANIYLIYYFWKTETDKRKELAEELGVEVEALEDDDKKSKLEYLDKNNDRRAGRYFYTMYASTFPTSSFISIVRVLPGAKSPMASSRTHCSYCSSAAIHSFK